MKIIMRLVAFLVPLLCLASALTLKKATRERKQICTQNPSYGSCNKHVTQWYYDFVHDRCMKFTWSSCGGNRNRFNNQYSCIGYCMDSRNRYEMQDFEDDYID